MEQACQVPQLATGQETELPLQPDIMVAAVTEIVVPWPMEGGKGRLRSNE